MLKLERFDEGVWFDHPSGARFKVRPVTPKDFLDIREKVRTKIAIKNISGEQEIIDDYDMAKLSLGMFNFMVMEWEGVEIVGGIPTTPESNVIVREAIFNNESLRDWIAARSVEVKDQAQKRLDSELKNFGSSQSGSQTKEG